MHLADFLEETSSAASFSSELKPAESLIGITIRAGCLIHNASLGLLLSLKS